MIYIYIGHLGSLYYTDYKLDYDSLYCEQCGDSDQFVGTATCKEDVYKLFEGEININGSGGWEQDYFENFINSIPFPLQED